MVNVQGRAPRIMDDNKAASNLERGEWFISCRGQTILFSVADHRFHSLHWHVPVSFPTGLGIHEVDVQQNNRALHFALQLRCRSRRWQGSSWCFCLGFLKSQSSGKRETIKPWRHVDTDRPRSMWMRNSQKGSKRWFNNSLQAYNKTIHWSCAI